MAASTSKHIVNHGDSQCPNSHQLQWDPNCNDAFTCDGCKESGSGSRYRCHPCNFKLHKECYQPSLTIQPRYLPPQTIFHFTSLLPPPVRFCDACGKKVRGFHYHCKDRRSDLHPCCTNLHREIIFSNERLILQVEAAPIRVASKTSCHFCKQKTLKGTEKGGAQGWSYVSASGAYRFHVYCMMEMLRKKRQSSVEMLRDGHVAEGEVWPAVVTFASTVTGTILGDPTVILAGACVDLLARLTRGR